jgi:hypothetical protein
MSKKFNRSFNLIVTLIVIALMGWLYFRVVRPSGEAEDETETFTGITLISRAENEVTEIIFRRGNEQSYVTPLAAERLEWVYSGAGEYILSPIMVREKARQGWLLHAVDTAHENTDYIEIASFGFDEPVLVMESVFYDGTRHTITLGSQTTDLMHYFVMTDSSDAMYLINTVTAERMLLGVADMIDLSLPHMQLQDVEYIRIAERGLQPIVLGLPDEYTPPPPIDGLAGLGIMGTMGGEAGSEQLIMLEPIPGMLINHGVMAEDLIVPISQLRLLEMESLHPADLSPYGLDDPIIEFVFRTADAEMHLLFGDTFTRNGMEFIYVKDANRPHVFAALAAHAAVITGVGPLDFTMRFIALIGIVDVESITVEAEENFIMVMNHYEENDRAQINPSVNGWYVEPRAFRQAFTHIISIAADADIAPFFPTSAPEVIITHYLMDGGQTEIRMYDYNANFLAVSLNGSTPQFVTNRRHIGVILDHLRRATDF